MTERLNQILFAEFLNQCGCDTGVDTEKLLKEFNLEDIDLTTEIIITAIFMPSGLGIYWITSNIFTIIQNNIVKRSREVNGKAKV